MDYKLINEIKKRDNIINKAKELAKTIISQHNDNDSLINISFVEACKQFLKQIK